jgi:hypothetical protein
MAFVLLQHRRFLSNDGSFRWQLVSQVLDHPVDSSTIRRLGISICRSYDELLGLLEYDVIVQVILATALPNLDFKDVFQLCWSALEHEEDLFSHASSLELMPDRMEYFWDMILEWNIISRSCRHDFLRNQKGTILITDSRFVDDASFSNLALALRRVLVWAHGDDFQAEAAFNFLDEVGGHEESALQAALESLFQSGFAVKPRARNRFKLLGFPVTLAEGARKLLVGSEDDSPDARYFDEFGRDRERQQRLSTTLTTLTASTNNSLLQNFGHEALTELLKMNLEILDLGRISVTSQPTTEALVFDFTPLTSAKSAIWMNCDGSFNEKVGRRCLRAVERLVKGAPGIPKSKLCTKLSLLVPLEIDICLQFLLACQSIASPDSFHFE